MTQDEKYFWGNSVKNNFDVHHVEAQHNEMLKSKNDSIIPAIVDDLIGMGAA
jgi:hypothetical protein